MFVGVGGGGGGQRYRRLCVCVCLRVRCARQALFFVLLVIVGVAHTGRDSTYTYGFTQAMEAALVNEEINSDYPDVRGTGFCRLPCFLAWLC